MVQPLDLSIILTEPPQASPSEIIASIALQCDLLGFSQAGDLLQDPLTQKERDDLRWYLEEYWKWPYLEFATRGRQVEELLHEVGKRLYRAAFESVQAQALVEEWQKQPGVHHQISIVSDIPKVLSLPWELFHDEHGFLVLRYGHPISIVRRLLRGNQALRPASFQPPLRILLITARPEGAGFIDQRSVAQELLDAVQEQVDRGAIELELLRPPTFRALRDRLNDLQRPIHVLHFDGHGAFDAELQKQGILFFETDSDGPSPVKGSDLAKVLRNHEIRLFVLTACESAMGSSDNAFSSVAAHLIQGGVDAVVAMSARVLVAAITYYVEALYRAIAEGVPVSLAHERARLALHTDPRRHLLHRRRNEEGRPVELHDWWLPHLYLQHSLTLDPSEAYRISEFQLSNNPIPRLGGQTPFEPRYGFIGRARELLQLERSLMRNKLVVIHGFGGIGKTALAYEAADWLTRTKMYDASCFISFEHSEGSAWLLSILGTFLGAYDNYYNLDDRTAALARLKPALKEKRILIIADNIETVLPDHNASLEVTTRSQLWDTLFELSAMGASVLLTSRTTAFSDVRLAPGSSVTHLELKGLHPEDAYVLAVRLFSALKIDQTNIPYGELLQLLEQLSHHPLAIQLVLPTLHELPLARIKDDFSAFLLKFSDDAPTERNRSLWASLSYSVRRLSEEQQAWLPHLAVFEGGANENILLAITEIPKTEWARLRAALELVALVAVEQIHEAIPGSFLRFHPVLTPFLRHQFGIDNVELYERYVRYYSLLVTYLRDKDKRNPQATRRWIMQELPNLRRALDLLWEAGKQETASVMAGELGLFLSNFGLEQERQALWRHIAAATTTEDTRRENVLTKFEDTLRIGIYRGEDQFRRGNLDEAHAQFSALLARIETLSGSGTSDRGSYEHYLVLSWLAHCLREQGQRAAAEERDRQALAVMDALLEQEPDNQHYIRERGVLQTDLCIVMQDAEQIQKVAEEALSIAQRQNDLRQQCIALSHLANVLLEQNKYAEARSYYLTLLTSSHALGEPQMVANSWAQLGVLAMKQHAWSEAEQCCRESLALNEQYGFTANVAANCRQLAEITQASNRPSESEGWYKRALVISEQTYGLEHSNVMAVLYELAVYYQKQGRDEEAERHYQRAVRIGEQALESEYPKVIFPLYNLIKLYISQGSYTAAEPLYERLLTISERMLGSEQLDMATLLESLAGLCQQRGINTQAETFLQRALTIRERTSDPGLVTSLNDLALFYRAQSRYPEAESLFRRALTIREQSLGPEHPDVAKSLNNLCDLYFAQGKYEEAKDFSQRALVINEQALGHEPSSTAGTLVNLITIYLTQDNRTEAEHLYQRVLALREQLSNEVQTIEVCRQLSTLALRLDRPRIESKDWLKRALESGEQVQPDSPSYSNALITFASLLVAEAKIDRSSATLLTEAQNCAERALAINEHFDDLSEMCLVLNILAGIAEMQGQIEIARNYRRREREIFVSIESNHHFINCQFGLLIALCAVAAQGVKWAEGWVKDFIRQDRNVNPALLNTLQQVWTGERNFQHLVRNLDGSNALILLRTIEILPDSTKAQDVTIEENMGSLPDPIYKALLQGDRAAFGRVFDALSIQERLDIVKAIHYLQSQNELKFSDALAYRNQGDAHYEQKEYQRAVADFNRAIELDPQDILAYDDRGGAYAKQGEYQRALADYDHAIELDATFARSYYNRGNVYLHQGEYQRALADYNRTIDLDPRHALAYNNRGNIYLYQKDYRRALADYDHAITADITFAPAYSGRALVYFNLKEYQHAIEDFDHALQLDPSDAPSYFNRGLLYLHLNDPKSASADFIRRWQMEPRNVLAACMHMWVKMGKERPHVEVTEYLDKCAAVDSLSYGAYICRGIASGLRGNLKEGLKELQRAIEIEPEAGEAYFWQGMLCAFLYKDQHQLAIDAIEKALAVELPPVLLVPLYWLAKDRPNFFKDYGQPLLEKYGI